MLCHNEREAETKVRAVPGAQPGPTGQAAEDFDPPAIISHELHRHEPLPCQQIESGNQGLACGDQVGSRRSSRGLRLGPTIKDDTAHGQLAIEVSRLCLIAEFRPWWRRWFRRPRLLLRDDQLEDGSGWNALKSSIEQEEPVKDRLTQGKICLLEPVRALAVELLLDLPV
jgi:hypothetical protein